MSKIKTAGELASIEYEKLRQLWGPIVTEGSLTLLYAKRGVGKSFFVFQVANAIATGGYFLKWKGCRKEKIFYIDGEMGYRALQQRLLATDSGAVFSFPGDSVTFMTYESCDGVGMWNISDPQDQKKYEQQFRDCRVIIIDNLLTTSYEMTKFDSEARIWSRIQPWFIKLRDQGKAIILVHHAGKSGEQLGTSMKENIMDNVIALHAIEPDLSGLCSSFWLKFEKHRHFGGDDAQTLKVNLLLDTNGVASFTWTSGQEERIRRVKEMRDMGIRPRQIADEMCLDLYSTMKLLEQIDDIKFKSDKSAEHEDDDLL